jgi:hypothetical protein
MNRQLGITNEQKKAVIREIRKYFLKNRLMESEGDEPERIFGAVNLGAISSGKTGNQRFDMDCRFVSEEEQ